jgi:hypothetical protein
MIKKVYKIRSEVWIYQGASTPSSNAAAMKGAWHFVTLPKKQSEDIKKNFANVKRGWGSLPVMVTVGKTKWKTSIFSDKKSGAYVLPIKSEVRKKENIVKGKTVSFSLEIQA